MTSLSPPAQTSQAHARAPADRVARIPERRGGGRLTLCVTGIGVLLASFAVSPDARGALGGALGLLTLAIARTDGRRFVIPDPFSGAAFALGIINAFSSDEGGTTGALTAMGSATLAACLFFVIRVAYRWIRGREGLGLGDVKLAAAAGAWLTLPMLSLAIEIAAATGLAAYLWRRCKRGRAMRAAARIPFGAFFAPAIWLAWLLDTGLANWG
jgi:leader peptidase (prepilin peptidase)/N-methyltransferase